MIFTKEMEGKTIYAIPTGNNARYSKDVTKFIVVKVKRKYVDLSRNGDCKWVVSYCPKTGATQEAVRTGYGNNAGYIFFESMEDLDRYEHMQKVKSDVKEYFRTWQIRLKDEQWLKVHDIIFLEDK